MATMLSVTGEVLGVFDTAEATRRVLGRGVLLPNFHQKIGAFKSWAEVGLETHDLDVLKATDFEVIDHGPTIPVTYECQRTPVTQ